MFNANTSHSACPVRIMYTQVMTGNNLHANELDDRIWRAPARPLAIIRLTEHSDYTGDSVHKSNYRVLWEKHHDTLIQIYGWHGYQALAYDATLGPVPPTEELYDTLGELDDYPLVNDDDHTHLEMELEAEAWDDHGRKDFRSALTALLDDIDPDHEHEIPDDDEQTPAELVGWVGQRVIDPGAHWGVYLTALWHTGCDKLNINGGSGHVIETGCTVHFYIDEWCAKAGGDRRYLAEAEMLALLALLAKATRIEE